VDNLDTQQNNSQTVSPQQMQEDLQDAVNGLLRTLEGIQTDKHNEKGNTASERELRDDIQNIIEALERSQHSLQESEARYRAIVESQTEVICRFQQNGTITFSNEAFQRTFGPLGPVSQGQNILAILPDNQKKLVKDHIAKVTPAHPVTQFEFPLQMPRGDIRWHQWNGLGNFNQQGTLEELQIVGHDITDRKLAELAARQHNRELSALHSATAALLTTLDPEALLSRILDAAISSIPAAKKGMIHLIAQDTGQLEMRASVGYTDPRIRRIRIPAVVGYVARAVREHTPQLIHNLHDDPENITGIFPEDQDVKSAIVAPLVMKGQVLGALSLESTKASAFNESDLRLLVSFGATATAAIQNARLHSEVQKLAITDALTGLYNRRGLFELGQREVERSRRHHDGC
jgi:PAS domain S-box-containing protein